MSCFGTFTEAIAAATGGRIADAPADPAAAVDPEFDNRIEAAGEAGPQSHIVLAISHSGTGHSGATLTSTSHSTCASSGKVHKSLGSIGSGWSDRISSFRSFADCRITLYNFTQCHGAQRTWTRNEKPTSIGAMNDIASSMRFTFNLPPTSQCFI